MATDTPPPETNENPHMICTDESCQTCLWMLGIKHGHRAEAISREKGTPWYDALWHAHLESKAQKK